MKTLCILLLASTTLLFSQGDPPRPNIILAMADDMGWGDPGYNSTRVVYADTGLPHPDQGWIDTPVMDSMAATGLRFDRFYAGSAVCSPTRGSCLTGRTPFRLGIPFAGAGRVQFDESLLSEVLSDAGYDCGHFGKWHLGTMTTLRQDSNLGAAGNTSDYSGPWHHAFADCFSTEAKVPTYHPYRITNNSAALPTSFADSNFYGTRYWKVPASFNELNGEGDVVPVGEVNDLANGDDSKLIVDQAIPFMQSAVAEGKPFFIVVWFHTPHRPHVDPEGVSNNNSPDAIKDGIEDMDEALGRLRSELDTLGVRDNTMFWVTSDNGPEAFGDDSPNETEPSRSIRAGRYLARKRSLHEGGLRVPGILEWPEKITANWITDFPAVTSDYYPTILDYLQLSVPNQKPLDGISLRPLIEGENPTRTKPIGFKISNGGNTVGDSWVNDQYKMISEGSVEWELFDLINIASGEEVEETTLATSNNINSQPQSVQDIYNTMLAEYNTWNTTVTNDTSYIHPSQPVATLTGPAETVTSSFTVNASFNEDISQLNANEFTVTNGVATNLVGSGTSWGVTITPTAGGPVSINLPEGSIIDSDGNINGPSNTLTVTYDATDAPDVALSSSAQTVDSSFEVTAVFSEEVTGLTAADFQISNGTASGLRLGPATYTLVVTPGSSGTVSVLLPANTADDLQGNGNDSSNLLEVTYAEIEVNLPQSQFVLTPFEGQTVDSDGNVPGNQNNNILKFTSGTDNDGVPAPFTSSLWVRSNGGISQRRVRTFLRFDLSSLGAQPITSATLRLTGHSLNDDSGAILQALPLAAEWSSTGSPQPTYDLAPLGFTIEGGNVVEGLDAATHTKDYQFDLTTTVRNWVDGVNENYGVRLQLSSGTVNNGVGFAPGASGIELVVEQQGLEIAAFQQGPGANDITLRWTSTEGLSYRIESNQNLVGTWTEEAEITGSGGNTTLYTDIDGMVGFEKQFYRVVLLEE